MSVPDRSFIPIITCKACGRDKALDCFLLDEKTCDPCHAAAEADRGPEGTNMATFKGQLMVKSLQKLALRLARERIDTTDLYYVGRTLRQLLAAVETACEKSGIDLDSEELPKVAPATDHAPDTEEA